MKKIRIPSGITQKYYVNLSESLVEYLINNINII